MRRKKQKKGKEEKERRGRRSEKIRKVYATTKKAKASTKTIHLTLFLVLIRFVVVLSQLRREMS